jgi:hypothetical protein
VEEEKRWWWLWHGKEKYVYIKKRLGNTCGGTRGICRGDAEERQLCMSVDMIICMYSLLLYMYNLFLKEIHVYYGCRAAALTRRAREHILALECVLLLLPCSSVDAQRTVG